MSLTVTLSKRPSAITRRIKNLPELTGRMVDAVLKKDAIGFIKSFQRGIKTNDLGLEKLAESTIKRKAGQSLSKPTTPLFGKGDEKKNSFINLFRLQKVKNGWQAVPREAKHHKSDLSLRSLFKVHEFGRVIQQQNKLIVIPPRPAGRNAFKSYLKKRSLADTSQRVKRAISQVISDGRFSEGLLLIKDLLKGTKRFET